MPGKFESAIEIYFDTWCTWVGSRMLFCSAGNWLAKAGGDANDQPAKIRTSAYVEVYSFVNDFIALYTRVSNY